MGVKLTQQERDSIIEAIDAKYSEPMMLSKWILKYQKANDYPDLTLSQDWALRAAKLESRIRELEAERKCSCATKPIGMENYYLCSRRHVPGQYCGECGR